MMRKFISFIMVFSLAVLVVSVVSPGYASAAESKKVPVVQQNNIQAPLASNMNSGVTKIQSKFETPVTANSKVHTQGIPFAKQIIVKALRVGGPALGTLIKKIPYKWAQKAGNACSKWGHKAADVIDELTNFGETAVTVALVKAGIPLADAQLIAKVVVFFLL
ncbi:hypothetical protein [Bacillus haynesii]|uniref:hypothetical protein n=1 Tax=Bacillus haynesii TaxID=1925021 RepID=UPI001F616A49|nr:hypothetical protein [Bacillus haynesii]MCI4129544.1 hypothetical protein [Bacillus haynesii]